MSKRRQQAAHLAAMPDEMEIWKRSRVFDRPKSVNLFPRATPYFREWKTLRWILLLALPSAASGIAMAARMPYIGGALFIWLSGAMMDVMLIAAVCSGMTSSNWGMYFRDREPARYWLGVTIIAVVYAAVSIIGYIAPVN